MVAWLLWLQLKLNCTYVVVNYINYGPRNYRYGQLLIPRGHVNMTTNCVSKLHPLKPGTLRHVPVLHSSTHECHACQWRKHLSDLHFSPHLFQLSFQLLVSFQKSLAHFSCQDEILLQHSRAALVVCVGYQRVVCSDSWAHDAMPSNRGRWGEGKEWIVQARGSYAFLSCRNHWRVLWDSSWAASP